MIRTKLITIVFFSLASIGCYSPPTQYQIDNADYGDMPTRSIAIAKAEALIAARLKDPGSAQYSWLDIEKDTFAGSGNKTRYAWRLSGVVNAKNSYGGYTGNQAYFIYFRGNDVVAMMQRKLNGTPYIVEADGVEWGNENLPRKAPSP